MIRLIAPSTTHETQVMALRAELLARGEGFDGCAGLEKCETYADWLQFEARQRAAYGSGYVPGTVRLAVDEENQLVGVIDFRHYLTDFLLNYGGHIGYTVVPARRGHGLAREMLRLMLEECRAAGLNRVLVCCDADNPASRKTITGCGGVLENVVPDTPGLGHSGMIERYWIPLAK